MLAGKLVSLLILYVEELLYKCKSFQLVEICTTYEEDIFNEIYVTGDMARRLFGFSDNSNR